MQMVLEVQGELESSESTTEELTRAQRFASIYAACDAYDWAVLFT